MERREYFVRKRSHLIDIRDYIEELYVKEGKGIGVIRDGKINVYHVPDYFGENSKYCGSVIVALCFSTNQVILTGNPLDIGSMKTDLENVIEGTLMANKIVKNGQQWGSSRFIN